MAIGYTTSINGSLNNTSTQVLYTGTPAGSTDNVIVTVDNTNLQITAQLNDATLPDKQDKIVYAIIDEKDGYFSAVDFEIICGSKYLNGIIFEDTTTSNKFYLTRKKVTATGNYLFIGEDVNGVVPVLTVNNITKRYEFEYIDQHIDKTDITAIQAYLAKVEAVLDIEGVGREQENPPKSLTIADLLAKYNTLNKIVWEGDSTSGLLSHEARLDALEQAKQNLNTTIATAIKESTVVKEAIQESPAVIESIKTAVEDDDSIIIIDGGEY